MSVIERVGNLNCPIERFAEFGNFFFEFFRQSFAFAKLHHDKETSVCFGDFVNLTNMRMVKRGGESRFTKQKAIGIFVGRFRWRQ